MTDINGSEDWRALCELATKEKDLDKLIDLIAKINRALEKCYHNPGYQADTTLSSHTVAPQLSQPAEYDC